MRNRRLYILMAAVLSTAFFLPGCGGGNAPSTTPGSSAQQSQVSGYYSVGQTVSGGTDMQFINLRDIKIEKKQTDTVVTMEFRDGSLLRGMEEKPTPGVPKYSTQWIEGIDRLVLNIYGLSYWDYKVYDEELKDTPILGIIKQTPVDSMLTKLYINLKGGVIYKVEEKDNFLTLSMRAVPEDEHTGYYVMLNAFDEFTDGVVKEEEGLLPTLCSDKLNITLISKPFATQSEANAFLEEKKKTVLPLLQGKNAIVKQLKSNLLPDYDEVGALTAYANASVIRAGSEEKTAPVLISNGKLLCWRPNDGMAYAYVTPFFMGSSDGAEPTSYEKIYVYDLETNTPMLLSNFEYASITKAEFSDDGRYLAFLQGEDGSNLTLCIYDFKSGSGQVATAPEAGFGANTTNFTWGSGTNAHTIYAITGESDTLQLMSYTPADNGTDPMVETLVEDAFTNGAMGFFEGKVYYAQSSLDSAVGGIYSFDTATRQISRVCDGDDFELNRKTGVMAIIKSNWTQISIYSIRSAVKRDISKDKDVQSVLWSGDGSILFYTIYKYEPESTERYKLTLYQYNTRTGENIEIADTIEGDFKPSDKSSEVLMVYIYAQDDRNVPITYRIGVTN